MKIELRGEDGDDAAEGVRDRSFYKSSDDEFASRGYHIENVAHESSFDDNDDDENDLGLNDDDDLALEDEDYEELFEYDEHENDNAKEEDE